MHGNVAAMEHDMLLAFEKAFRTPSPDLSRLRRRAYGNLHLMLAGSYFASGSLMPFVSHAGRALAYAPRTLAGLVGYPFRAGRRAMRRTVRTAH